MVIRSCQETSCKTNNSLFVKKCLIREKFYYTSEKKEIEFNEFPATISAQFLCCRAGNLLNCLRRRIKSKLVSFVRPIPVIIPVTGFIKYSKIDRRNYLQLLDTFGIRIPVPYRGKTIQSLGVTLGSFGQNILVSLKTSDR